MPACDTQAPACLASWVPRQQQVGSRGTLSLWAAAEGTHEAAGEGDSSGLAEAWCAGRAVTLTCRRPTARIAEPCAGTTVHAGRTEAPSQRLAAGCSFPFRLCEPSCDTTLSSGLCFAPQWKRSWFLTHERSPAVRLSWGHTKVPCPDQLSWAQTLGRRTRGSWEEPPGRRKRSLRWRVPGLGTF